MLRPSSVAFSDSFPPRGSLKKGIDLHFKLLASIRYETGDARPRGEAFIKGLLYCRGKAGADDFFA